MENMKVEHDKKKKTLVLEYEKKSNNIAETIGQSVLAVHETLRDSGATDGKITLTTEDGKEIKLTVWNS